MKIAIISAFCLAFLILGFRFLTPSSASDDVVRIGMMSGWAPFMIINKHGEFEGFDVDIAKELARRLGKKSEIIDMGALSSLFVALDRNKVDLVLSGLDITEERLQKINMIPYCGDKTAAYQLLFWKEIPENISRIEDLKNYPNATIVVEPGVSAEKYLSSFDFIGKKQIASLTDRLLDLQYGKSLAMLLEGQIARQLMAKNSNLKSLVVPLPPEFQIHGMGIAAKKENAVFADQIQALITDMRNDGTLKKLESKWQLDEARDEA